MRKFIYYLIPIVILGIFVLIMLSGTYFKNSRNMEDNFPGILTFVKTNINNEHWDIAAENIDKLDSAWKKVSKRIQFSAERDEMNQIDMNISRLKGAISAKDKANALIELSEATMHWNNIGK